MFVFRGGDIGFCISGLVFDNDTLIGTRKKPLGNNSRSVDKSSVSAFNRAAVSC